MNTLKSRRPRIEPCGTPDHFLCAFRKGHGCQTTILRLLEDWKQALDCNEYIVAILMDLSKAITL
jgi:hypothetical protein